MASRRARPRDRGPPPGCPGMFPFTASSRPPTASKNTGNRARARKGCAEPSREARTRYALVRTRSRLTSLAGSLHADRDRQTRSTGNNAVGCPRPSCTGARASAAPRAYTNLPFFGGRDLSRENSRAHGERPGLPFRGTYLMFTDDMDAICGHQWRTLSHAASCGQYGVGSRPSRRAKVTRDQAVGQPVEGAAAGTAGWRLHQAPPTQCHGHGHRRPQQRLG